MHLVLQRFMAVLQCSLLLLDSAIFFRLRWGITCCGLCLKDRQKDHVNTRTHIPLDFWLSCGFSQALLQHNFADAVA